jgi:hypothetical protein
LNVNMNTKKIFISDIGLLRYRTKKPLFWHIIFDIGLKRPKAEPGASLWDCGCSLDNITQYRRRDNLSSCQENPQRG